MTAKEMFEKVGYKFEEEKEYSITYSKDNGWHYIRFYFELKEFGVYDYDHDNDITIDELKAINKQVEELGWK